MGEISKSKILKLLQPMFQAQRTIIREQSSLPMQEPYIYTGYRLEHQPWTFYMLSLFNWHNETLNVWTHLIATVYVLLRLAGLGQEYDLLNSSTGTVILGYSLGALAVVSLSAIAHLFHARSLKSHYRFFMLDYVGVSLYSFGCGIVSIYRFCTPSMYSTIGWFYIPLHLFLCFNNFFCTSIGKIHYMGTIRKVLTVSSCAGSTLWLLVPVFGMYYSCIMDDTCSIWSLNHIAQMYFGLFLSTITYVAHQPEKSHPGCFDIIGHSHQWFHMFVLFTIYSQFSAMEYELKKHRSVLEEVSLWSVSIWYIILLTMEVVAGVLLQPMLYQKLSEIESCTKHKMK